MGKLVFGCEQKNMRFNKIVDSAQNFPITKLNTVTESRGT